jgi:carbon storage regulator
MLVLSRKEGERIVIGDNIVVTLLRVKGNSIRIGIDADRDVPIRRHDLRASSSYELVGAAPAVSTTA